MDFATYAILLAGALAGGFVSGLAGFGTALMALGIWLYILPPAVAVPLVLICSVSSQISTLPSMWKVLDFRLAGPFVLGGLLCMPIGALLVARADPQNFKLGVGVMLLIAREDGSGYEAVWAYNGERNVGGRESWSRQ